MAAPPLATPRKLTTMRPPRRAWWVEQLGAGRCRRRLAAAFGCLGLPHAFFGFPTAAVAVPFFAMEPLAAAFFAAAFFAAAVAALLFGFVTARRFAPASTRAWATTALST